MVQQITIHCGKMQPQTPKTGSKHENKSVLQGGECPLNGEVNTPHRVKRNSIKYANHAFFKVLSKNLRKINNALI
jgi:hypothetical protein